MTATFARGKIAWGLCDRCGQRYYLHELRTQIIDQKDSKLLVCPTCLDVDHPQYRLGKIPVYDPQALQYPRPDKRTDVTNNPMLTGTYTAFGQPIFTVQVTPSTDVVATASDAGTTK